jgi:hypothetical protein
MGAFIPACGHRVYLHRQGYKSGNVYKKQRDKNRILYRANDGMNLNICPRERVLTSLDNPVAIFSFHTEFMPEALRPRIRLACLYQVFLIITIVTCLKIL